MRPPKDRSTRQESRTLSARYHRVPAAMASVAMAMPGATGNISYGDFGFAGGREAFVEADHHGADLGLARFLSIERCETHATANSYESTRKAIEEFGLVPILYNGAKNQALKGVPHIGTQLSNQGKQLAGK